MTTPPTRTRRRRLLAPAVGLAVGAAILSAPLSAQAAYTQYALNFPAHESTPKYSAVATVRGGKGYPISTIMRFYVQTLSSGVLVASAFGDDGSAVNLSHASYSGAKSRCYWDYVGGTVAGNPEITIDCWRLS
jgi:hypothetical protein